MALEQTPKSIRNGPDKPIILEPASGERKKAVELQCAALIEGSSFDGEAWRKFASNMVDLTGGEQDKNGTIKTSYIVDKENGRAISFRRLEAFRVETFLLIAPEWMALPDNERKAVESRITEPFVHESVSTGYITTGYTYPPHESTVTTMRHTIIYPPSYKGKTYAAYGIDVDLKESKVNSCWPHETRLNDAQRKTLAAQIFKTWKNSSNP